MLFSVCKQQQLGFHFLEILSRKRNRMINICLLNLPKRRHTAEIFGCSIRKKLSICINDNGLAAKQQTLNNVYTIF